MTPKEPKYAFYIETEDGQEVRWADSQPGDELDRCEQLGIDYYVFHPGANPDTNAGIAMM